MRKTTCIPFDMSGSFTQLYFGRARDKEINQKQLSQFLHDYHNRYSKYAFKAFDKEGTGFISTDDFCDMIFSIKKPSSYIQSKAHHQTICEEQHRGKGQLCLCDGISISVGKHRGSKDSVPACVQRIEDLRSLKRQIPLLWTTFIQVHSLGGGHPVLIEQLYA